MNTECREGSTKDYAKGREVCCRGSRRLPKSAMPSEVMSPTVDKTPDLMKKLLPDDGLPHGSTPRDLQRENETDLREALENFRAYLSILREWDQEERLETGNA